MSLNTHAAVDARPPGSAAMLRLIRSGQATSRTEIAKQVGMSPSTVSARIDHLITLGFVREDGLGESRGGRRPRRLSIRPDAGVVGCADLGIDRVSVGLVDFSGSLIAERHVPLDLAAGPEVVLASVCALWTEMLAAATLPNGTALQGVSVAVPGPVSSRTERIVSPARMPGWNGVNVPAILGRLTGLPALVNNDANMMAVAEYAADPGHAPNQVFIKADSGIGCGVISAGDLYTGSYGTAGDISHVSVPGATPVPCSCGRTGCLDALASGLALVRAMRESGAETADVAAVIALARDADPLAGRLLREAGVMTGSVLATIVNFFNPDRLVLGGELSQSEVFVAGVRSALYAECLPMSTENLEVAVARLPTSGGLIGAGKVALDNLLFRDHAPGTPLVGDA
ncbi:MAG TPA: ROK family transcriptional regulator [Cellulomonadaceae bacterium]|nr:ROK family transcriptional regulator [Cellulomonadaceae bacterium]